MIATPTADVAQRVVGSIDPDGDLAGLSVPLAALDPGGLRFWVARVVGDTALADALADVDPVDASFLLAVRRAQCERVLSREAMNS